MPTTARMISLLDHEPAVAGLEADVHAGLSTAQRTLPCKYFYDERGSRLFDQICDLEEYYPTRTESAIMQDNIHEMAQVLGDRCQLIEYGSGSSLKTRILLDHTPALASYVPVDISRQHLLNAAHRLAERYPWLEILPICADYTQPFAVPRGAVPSTRAVVYFPGSTIGNFHPQDALPFLTQIAETCGKGGGLLIGVDLKKDTGILEAAYNDRLGVTAAFNMNLLSRINHELGANFDLAYWRHHAEYNHAAGRIEMHLISLRSQTVQVGAQDYQFASGERIHTECSYKYSVQEFGELASNAGWSLQKVWTDPNNWFSVQYLTAC